MKTTGDTYYHSSARIDLEALDYNLKQIKKIVSNKVKVLATVKANAYGHGITGISKFLEDKVDYLGVAFVEEGVKIRKGGVKTPVLILGNTLAAGLPEAVDFDLTVTLTEKKTAYILEDLAASKGRKVKVQIKIDTGMGRIGFWYKDALKDIMEIHGLKRLEIEGIYTHLSSAGGDEDFTREQLKRFNGFIEEAGRKGIEAPLYHAANSLATLRYKESHFNLVRPGLILYGVYPSANLEGAIKVRPVLSFTAKVVYVKEVEAGRSVSYDRSYIAEKRMKVATVSAGYADGYSHLLTHKAKILINGRFAPVIGKICMDHIMADVSHIKEVKIGDEAVLIGRDNNKEITAEELARMTGTIPYETLCRIGERVKRIYLNGKTD
ncbi:MAG: alanine racemase [Candidatus Omnitrophica bacterium]|nr:alanine racemase [Candidatus Omnitrophota bacterium]